MRWTIGIPSSGSSSTRTGAAPPDSSVVVDAADRRVARPGREPGRLEVAELGRSLGDRLGLGRVGQGLELGLGLGDDRVDLVVGLVQGELLVGGDAAVLRAGQRRVRAALAVREHRRAAAGEVALLAALAAEGRLGLLLGELGVADDVDLPAGQPVGEAGVHALLADRERELVVGDDDGRLLLGVVEVDLADARRRERLRDEPGRLLVPGDDVDLLAAELGDDHADARAARADAGADRVDALRVRLDGDLRAVARLAGDPLDRDEPVGDLGHLELEQRLDQLGVAAREDDLRPLGAGADVGDHRLDAGALLVALAVDLLLPGQERLDLAEVDEHVVAVAGLLDDPGDDLADAVDVLVVHHLALRLADPLQDHLLGGLRRDAAEVVRRHVLALHQLVGNLRPVDVEVVVVQERVVLLVRLLLDPLELVERPLAGLVEQPALEVGGKLDRVDAVVARVVELDRGMPRGARRLLVGRKEGVLERREQRFRVDALLALDLPNRLNDLLAHHAPTLRRSDWPARSRRTVCRPARRSRSQAGRTARPPRRSCRGACGRRS